MFRVEQIWANLITSVLVVLEKSRNLQMSKSRTGKSYEIGKIVKSFGKFDCVLAKAKFICHFTLT